MKGKGGEAKGTMKKGHSSKNERGRSSFLIRVQLGEERIRMQLTDNDTRVGVVLDLLRARCPGFRIDSLFTFDGCEMEENDKIVDLCDYGECIVVTSGLTAETRIASAVLSSFGSMSCVPRPCVVSMPAYVSTDTLATPLAFGLPCVVEQRVAESMREIYVAINGDSFHTVMVPVRLDGGVEAGAPALACRGGVGVASMRRIEVKGGGASDGALSSVQALQNWVRQRSGNLASWCSLYTHIFTPPPLPLVYSNGAGLGKPAVVDSGWWSKALREDQTLPVLNEGQRVVVCTKSYGITVTGDMWASWKCMPLNLTGPDRLQIDDKVILADPVRHEDMSALLKSQQTSYPWLKLMQRCGAEMLDGSIHISDEVSFTSVMAHSHPPGASSAGRISLRLVAAPAPQGPCTARNEKFWEDESVWAALPPHAHVLPLLFTAGPHLLFCSYMNIAPVSQWLVSCPVQALDAEEMLLVYRTLIMQSCMALQHFHDHGALHLGSCICIHLSTFLSTWICVCICMYMYIYIYM